MSQEAKRRLVGGVGMIAILTLFGSLIAVPLWSESATSVIEPREILLEARDLAFGGDNPTLEFRPGERVRLIVRNTDTGVLHSIRLPGIDDRVHHVRWGEQVVIEFTAPEAGDFEYTCPQHAPKMRGKIVISD